MTPFAIAGVQMHVTTQNNIDAMRHRIDLLMHLFPWVQMVMFAELACYGPLLQHAQPLPGASEEAFRTMARHHRIWLVNGSMYERREGGIYNTTSVINPEGEIIGRYRKMFPFLPLEQGVQPAPSSSLFDIDGVGKFGILNCYDIWFPETSRTAHRHGRRGHPASGDDPYDRPRCRHRHQPRDGGDDAVLHVRRERPGRRRQWPVLRVRSLRPRPVHGRCDSSRSSRSRSTWSRCAVRARTASAASAR